MSGPASKGRGWHKLPQGKFTGIDWAAPGALEKADPYLAWAETAGFQGFRPAIGDSDPEWLPLLIELAPNASVSDLVLQSSTTWLQVPRAYLDVAGLRFCTARAKRKFFEKLASGHALSKLIARYELGLPVGLYAKPLTDPATSKPTSIKAPAAAKLSGKVVGVVDNGVALGHADFVDQQGQSRVHAYWRQDGVQGPYGRAAASVKPRPLDPQRAGPTPRHMGYGHELSAKAIAAAILRHREGKKPTGSLDEDGLYTDLQIWGLQHTAHHGTHVTSLAAGPYMYADTLGTEATPPDWAARDRDAASRAPIVAVQLDWASVADTSGGALNVSVLDALVYILSQCSDKADLTVNVSWGTLAGPHDGSGMIEAAMDHLCTLLGGRLTLVLPAGNAYQSRTHANALLEKTSKGGKPDEVTLHWRVQPDDHSQSFLELWLADASPLPDPNASFKGVTVAIKPPGAKDFLKPLALGDSRVWPSVEHPQCAVLFPRRSALGEQGTSALIALAPTASFVAGRTLTAAGRWEVRVLNEGSHGVIVDAYIERDDVAMGSNTLARQSYFEDRCYDTSGGIDSFIDHQDDPTPIRRSGIFNTLATGKQTVSVGGIRYFRSAFDPAARYSPRLPDPDASRPGRPNVIKTPDRLAISDDSVALWGVRAAGTRSAARVRLVGTSAAAPQVTRDLYNRK